MGAATIEEAPPQVARGKSKPIPARRYHVILLDDDEHSYAYVIVMLGDLFGYSREKAFQMAEEVDTTGRVIVWTGSREVAELKQEQIHAYPADPLIAHCQGAMTAVLEAAD